MYSGSYTYQGSSSLATRALHSDSGRAGGAGGLGGGGGVVYSGFGKMVALQESVAMILMALDAPKEALLTYSHTLDVLTDRADDVLQVAGGAGGAAGGGGAKRGTRGSGRRTTRVLTRRRWTSA